MMKIIDQVSRYLVGGLFIFSGLIKLNDPIGTKIKLEEYFDVFSVDFAPFFEWFVPIALPIGMFLVILEIVLGIAVLFNYKMNITTWVLLLLILFFSFLTFYSAYFNKVTDCGCFGDAIPLTPWQSFIKDVILVVFIAHLFWYRKKFTSFIKEQTGHIVIISTAVISLIVGIYAIEHLPYIDFRPYKIGANIYEQMQAEEAPIIEYTFEKEGEEIKSLEYKSEKEGYKYIDSQVLNEDKTLPKIQDYQVISPDDEDITEQSLSGIKLIYVIQDMKTLRQSGLPELAVLTNEIDGKLDIMIFTSVSEENIENIRHEYQIAASYNFVDGTVLKAMVRSNPGIMLWKDGVVLGKWHINDIPNAGEIAGLL